MISDFEKQTRDCNLPIYEQDLFIDSYSESSNLLEIPDLRLDMQPKYCERPFVLWGEQKRTMKMYGHGVLHFYTDDYRFGQDLFEHPEKILKHNPGAIVEPNYSLFQDTPIAFGMHAVFKKRFIARAMQDRGIRVFVDLNVASKFYKLNLIGVPKGYSSFCTRGYSDRINYLAFEYEMAKTIASGNRLLFVVYGGGQKVKEFCMEHGLIYVTPVVTLKNKAKAFDKIKESIAFFGQELNPLELMPSLKELPTIEDIAASQVEDYSKKKLE